MLPLATVPDETPPPPTFTVGDAAHSIAALAYEISKRFKGFTTTDGLRAVEIALNQATAERMLQAQTALEAPSFPSELIEDDPEGLLDSLNAVDWTQVGDNLEAPVYPGEDDATTSPVIPDTKD